MSNEIAQHRETKLHKHIQVESKNDFTEVVARTTGTRDEEKEERLVRVIELKEETKNSF